jgi:hypothetical protein
MGSNPLVIVHEKYITDSRISILSVSLIFLLEFGNVPRVWYFGFYFIATGAVVVVIAW